MKILICQTFLVLSTLAVLHCASISPEPVPNPSVSVERGTRAADSSKSSSPQILSAKLEIMLAPKDDSSSKDSKTDDDDIKNSTSTKDKKNSTTISGSATLKTKRSPAENEELSKISEKTNKEKDSTMPKSIENEEKVDNKSKSKQEESKQQKPEKEQTKSDEEMKKTDFIILNTDDKYDVNIEQRFRINDAEFRSGFQKGVKDKDEREMIKVNKEKQTDKNIKDEDGKN